MKPVWRSSGPEFYGEKLKLKRVCRSFHSLGFLHGVLLLGPHRGVRRVPGGSCTSGTSGRRGAAGLCAPAAAGAGPQWGRAPASPGDSQMFNHSWNNPNAPNPGQICLIEHHSLLKLSCVCVCVCPRNPVGGPCVGDPRQYKICNTKVISAGTCPAELRCRHFRAMGGVCSRSCSYGRVRSRRLSWGISGPELEFYWHINTPPNISQSQSGFRPAVGNVLCVYSRFTGSHFYSWAVACWSTSQCCCMWQFAVWSSQPQTDERESATFTLWCKQRSQFIKGAWLKWHLSPDHQENVTTDYIRLKGTVDPKTLKLQQQCFLSEILTSVLKVTYRLCCEQFHSGSVLQECPPSAEDFREMQCAAFNNRPLVAGNSFRWTTFHGGQSVCGDATCSQQWSLFTRDFGFTKRFTVHFTGRSRIQTTTGATTSTVFVSKT